MLSEVGWRPSKGKSGRREVLLSINPEFGYIIAVSIEREHTKYALFNLNAIIIDQIILHHPEKEDVSHELDKIRNSVNDLILQNGLIQSDIIGMGITIPGVIDYHKQVVIEGGLSQQWNQYPIISALKKHFMFPIFIENNVKAVTLSEFHYGCGRNSREMVCLWMDDGIGMGAIQNRQLVRGSDSSNGEIGFWKLITGFQSIDPLLNHKDHKIWGDVLSIDNFIRSVHRGIDQGWNTTLHKENNLEDIIFAGTQKDPLVLYLYQTLGKLIGHLCSLIIYMISPSMIVFSGPLFSGNFQFFEEIQKHLKNNYLHNSTNLRPGSLKDDSVLIGGMCLVIDDFLSLPMRHWVSQTRSNFKKTRTILENKIVPNHQIRRSV